MVTTNILQQPALSQWDSDSCCQASSCRPTSEAMIASFYLDRHISPCWMRHEMGYWSCGGTNGPSGVRGLARFGIPSAFGVLSPSQIYAKLAANIPVDLAIIYGKIPRNSRYIQDMGFFGTHSVVACRRVYKNGSWGLLIRDPDRWGTGKVPYVFWPDYIWYPAYRAEGSLALWPTRAKAISAPTTTTTKYKISVKGSYFWFTLNSGTIVARMSGTTGGFTVHCTAPAPHIWPGHSNARLVRVTEATSSYNGRWIGLGTPSVTLITL